MSVSGWIWIISSIGPVRKKGDRWGSEPRKSVGWERWLVSVESRRWDKKKCPAFLLSELVWTLSLSHILTHTHIYTKSSLPYLLLFFLWCFLLLSLLVPQIKKKPTLYSNTRFIHSFFLPSVNLPTTTSSNEHEHHWQSTFKQPPPAWRTDHRQSWLDDG